MCLAVGNYDHSILRNAKGKGLCDVPGVRDEVNNFAEKILEFGFKPSNVFKAENVNYTTIMQQIENIREIIKKNHKKGLKTLVVIYFAGHGCMYLN